MNFDYEHLESRILAFMQNPEPQETEFNDCALEIHRYQRKFNAPYDNYCRHTGIAVDLTHWKEIPAVPQVAFKRYALRAFPEEQTTKTFRTSGTTGEGYGSHHFRSTRLYDAAILRAWEFFKLPVLPQIILVPPPADAPHSSLSHMMGVMKECALAGEQHFCVISRTGIDLDVFLSAIQNPRPIILLGTALAFLHFFEKENLPKLPPGSFAMETGGYKGSGRNLTKAELYSAFTEHLGLPSDNVINEYGMTELSSQFYTHGIGNAHLAPPWLKAVIIDPETGDEVAVGGTGLVRIYDLANLGSVIGIQTQDLAIRREKGFELLGRDPSALPRGCSRAADEMLSHLP